VSRPDDIASLEEKLDLLIGLFRIAHNGPIDAERQAVRGEPVSNAILELSGDWIEAGKLKTAVAMKTKVSIPTVSRRLAELSAKGILSRAGRGPSVRYRSTGLLDG
jgi:DNA-binding transcriptional ArsR family regulator